MSTLRVVKNLSDAKLDIVFVHGVETNQKSWTTEDSVFWPETILPGLIPNARILAFESEDITVNNLWNTEDMVTEVGDALIGELVDVRSGDLAIDRAANSDEAKPIADSAVGLLLFGTPHYVPDNLSEAAKYFKLAQLEVPSSADLHAKSQHLLRVPQAFAQFKQAASVKLACFYEGAPTKVNDEEFKIVEPAVAQFPDGTQNNRLGYNHHGMSCFKNDQDKEFKKILRVLKSWVESLPEPEEKGTVNNISNASFAGSTNSGLQLGQNAGSLNGFRFG
ncbi:WD domain [Aspergillus affinis]|uniref:WD domain n=1 Tax=Aspergillus affinis TaxID=1070780 RepID=UPI0022FECFB9|nr:WD domain [Aspergillus affinis]KAI9043655.1 WD domain [Aspergillus affinis]